MQSYSFLWNHRMKTSVFFCSVASFGNSAVIVLMRLYVAIVQQLSLLNFFKF